MNVNLEMLIHLLIEWTHFEELAGGHDPLTTRLQEIPDHLHFAYLIQMIIKLIHRLHHKVGVCGLDMTLLIV